MINRTFVMLAEDCDHNQDHFAGWFWSEKKDGQRAIWIPETRGKPIAEVPFANTALDNRNHTCTGLWSRGAKVIHAPEAWIETLPTHTMLDGELWIDRGQNQYLQSVVSQLRPGIGWSQVKYHLIDFPTTFFLPGRVYNKEYEYVFPAPMSAT